MLAQVMVACPTTHHPVATDLTARPATWATITLAPRSLRCPACHQSHRWAKADAWLQSDATDAPVGD